MILDMLKEIMLTVSVLLLNVNIDSNYILEKNNFYVESPLMILSIPKINVNNNVYDFNSKLNDIDKNVQLMRYSDLPNKDRGNVILGGHSGSGVYAYFKDFDSLIVGDDIYLTMENTLFHYKVVDIFIDSKDGNITISHNDLTSRITLFTCNPNDKRNYLVIIGELV